MAERSKRISLFDSDKIKEVNPETLSLFHKYERDMSIRELSPNTIQQYTCDLSQWFVFIHDNQFNVSVKEITDDDLEEYFYWRKQQGNNANRQKRVMSSISAFYKFLRKKKLIVENPAEFIDRPHSGQPITVQTYLTRDQISLMRDKLKDYGDLQLLVYAFLSLTTMARVNAISHLRWAQIDMDERVCSNVLEKEGKLVELSFSRETAGYMRDLLKYRADNHINDYGWVFPSNNPKNPISNTTLLEWCKKIGGMIDVPTLHPHDFRHSYATLLKNDGGLSLEDVSTLLNHAGTDVTKKYYIKEDTSKIRAKKDTFEI